MLLIKLTNVYGGTKFGCEWGEGVTNVPENTEDDAELCSDTVVHAYRTVGQALIMNVMHGAFESPLIWQAEGTPVVDDGTKVGCRSLTTIERLPRPDWWRGDTRSRVLLAVQVLATQLMIDKQEAVARESGACYPHLQEAIAVLRPILKAVLDALATGSAVPPTARGDLSVIRARFNATLYGDFLDAVHSLEGSLGHVADLAHITDRDDRERVVATLHYRVAVSLNMVHLHVLESDDYGLVADDRQLIVGVIDRAIALVTGGGAEIPGVAHTGVGQG